MAGVIGGGKGCEELVQHLVEYIDGMLNDKELVEFQRHVLLCPECSRLVSEYSIILTRLRNEVKRVFSTISWQFFLPAEEELKV